MLWINGAIVGDIGEDKVITTAEAALQVLQPALEVSEHVHCIDILMIDLINATWPTKNP